MGDEESTKCPPCSDTMSRQETMDKFLAIDNTVKEMFSLLQNLSGNQNPSVSVPGSASASASGNDVSPSPQASQVHPATAPSFIKVASPQSFPGQVQPPFVLPNSIFPVDAGHAMPQSLLPQPAVVISACSVSPALPPVPGYLVMKIQSGQYIDLALLRPVNLRKLPTEEPNQLQLTRLLRSELQSISTFVDWSEAWAVYVAVLTKKAPEKISSLLSYYLLLSTAQRDIPGSGWLAYDSAFRKQVVDNPSDNWGEVVPTLWMTTVFTQVTQNTVVREGSGSNASKPILPCFKWNDGDCTVPRCRFSHNVCSSCRGAHKKLNCPEMAQSAPSTASASSSVKMPQHLKVCARRLIPSDYATCHYLHLRPI